MYSNGHLFLYLEGFEDSPRIVPPFIAYESWGLRVTVYALSLSHSLTLTCCAHLSPSLQVQTMMFFWLIMGPIAPPRRRLFVLQFSNVTFCTICIAPASYHSILSSNSVPSELTTPTVTKYGTLV